MSKATQLAFNGGEFTEFMDSRVDVAKYGKGCRTLENMNVLPYGAATARTGTKFGGEVHDSTKPVRLIPFVFSDTTTFQIEFSKDSIRFWKDGALIEESPGVPYVVSPRPEIGGTLQNDDDVWNMHFEQINDVVYFTAPDQPLKKLVRYADDDWRVELEIYSNENLQRFPPLGNVSREFEVSLGVGANVAGATGVVMTAHGFTFDHLQDVVNDHTLREVFVVQYDSRSSRSISARGQYNYLAVDGSWNVSTTGTGERVLVVEVSYDGGSNYSEEVDQTVDGDRRNVIFSRTSLKPAMVRMRSTGGDSGGFRDIITGDTGVFEARFEVVGYISSSQVLVDVIFPFMPQGDVLWEDEPLRFKRSKYNSQDGYPASVVLHRNRLCLGLTDLDLSTSGDYGNFHSTELSDSAFSVALRKSGSPKVRWLKDLRELRVGMTSDEAVVTTENVAEGFSYKNYYARFDSSYGSLPIKPETVNGSLLFVTNDAEVLRNQVITGIENYYDANTLTTLADHILKSGVVQTGLQRQPYPTYCAVREDGVLAVMLYEEAQSIMAWSRHVTDGKYKSVSVVPRPRGEDEVAFIVERVIDGVTKQFVEFRVPDMSKTLRDELYSDMWYVDCGIQVTGTAMATVTGLSHLEGKEVAVLADGIKQTNKTVVAGEITLDAAADKVIVGLPYSYTLEPMMLNSAEVMGQSKQIAAAIVYLWRSGEGLVSVNGGLESRLKTDTDFTGAGLHDGSSGKINVDADWSRETSLTLRGESPLPLNVQSITLEFAIGRK